MIFKDISNAKILQRQTVMTKDFNFLASVLHHHVTNAVFRIKVLHSNQSIIAIYKKAIITYASIILILITACTNQPTEWAVSRGWSCQDYVNKGYSMSTYCTKDSWIADQNCGETCAEFGLITDPNCGEGKMFLR